MTVHVRCIQNPRTNTYLIFRDSDVPLIISIYLHTQFFTYTHRFQTLKLYKISV